MKHFFRYGEFLTKKNEERLSWDV